MLGFGLVIGLIALLLVGTIYGLSSFQATMKSIESKHAELNEAERFKAAVKKIKEGTDKVDELTSILNGTQNAREALDNYEAKLQDTLKHHCDPDGGFEEKENV